jgi:hypothetical protein
MCRNSSATTSSRQPEHFHNDEDFFLLDTTGDKRNLEFECLDTLAEMLVIVHQHQSDRAAAISTVQQAFAESHTTPTQVRKRSNNYDMLCTPVHKPLTSTISNDANEENYGGPAASSLTVIRRSAIRDELFDDSD